MVKTYEFTCEKCGTVYTISANTYNSRKRSNLPNYCKVCMKKYTNEKLKQMFTKLSPEEKKKFIEKRNWYSRATQEEKEKFRQKMKDIDANKTPEQKAEENRKNSLGLRRHWKTVSKEAKAKRINPMQKAMQDKISTMTDEERGAFFKDRYEKWSDEAKEESIKRVRVAMTEYNNSMSYDEKLERVNHMNEYLKSLPPDERSAIAKKAHQWYYNLDAESKMAYAEAKRDIWDSKSQEEKMLISQQHIQWWADLPLYEKLLYTKKKMSNSNGRNKFHQKFERLFNDSTLNEYFYFVPEDPYIGRITHSWDYGIYDQNGELVMVVDLDGAYFHADICDYDGVHSREEYDERRGLTISNDTKYCIINEDNIHDGFAFMSKILSMTYEQYVDHMFQMYRKMPFPEPRYSDRELINSYEKLQRMDCNDKYHQDMSVNTRLSDRLILHFHPSIYQQSVDGHMSPYDAWYDDRILRQHTQDHILYHSYLNPNKILQGFNVSPIAPRIRFLSGGKAKMIVNRYLSDYDVIFDPNMGYGGTMLGTVSLGKKFIGVCADDTIRRENEAMVKFLRQCYSIDVTINPDGNKYPCIFTAADDEHIREYVKRYHCQRYLFIVKDTDVYREHIVEEYSASLVNKDTFKIIMIERED